MFLFIYLLNFFFGFFKELSCAIIVSESMEEFSELITFLAWKIDVIFHIRKKNLLGWFHKS